MVAMTEPGGAVEVARARVRAAVAGAAGAGTLRPPVVLALRPLRPLPAPLAGKVAARAAAGLDRAGTDRPRGRWRPLRRDPLRLTRAERRALRFARSWESRQPWIGPHSAGRERALVTVACGVVARICATDAWGSPHLDGHRIRLDLGVELDEIDAHAFSMAGRAAPSATAPAGGDGRVEHLWLATVDRVAALDTYATHLIGLDGHLAQLGRAEEADRRLVELALDAERDGYASDHLGVLADELTGLSAAVVEVTDGTGEGRRRGGTVSGPGSAPTTGPTPR